MQRLQLLPSLGVGRLGRQCYVFDRLAARSPVLTLRTQKISRPLHDVIETLSRFQVSAVPRTLDEILALFPEEQPRRLVDLLIRKGMLIEVPDAAPGDQATLQNALELFDREGLRQPLRADTFFHLPVDPPLDELDVAIVGVPLSSTGESTGTELAPAALRSRSRQHFFWFDVAKEGLYADSACNGRLPIARCRDITLGDLGDIGTAAKSTGELFRDIESFCDAHLRPHRMKPLFIGGDHAVTFPLVEAVSKLHKPICLIHFDAHNDLLFSGSVGFHHASVINALLARGGIERVLSLGLRTRMDSRTQQLSRLAGEPALADRAHLYSLAACKELLADPRKFRRLLREFAGEMPCYLSIDLDVLSAASIGHKLSTPAGAGLEWHELHSAIELVFDELTVIAADVVEYNVLAGNVPHASVADDVLALIVQLIDRLAGGANA